MHPRQVAAAAPNERELSPAHELDLELFFDPFREGDVEGLRELLVADVHMVGDDGGKAPQWKPIIGAENVPGCSP